MRVRLQNPPDALVALREQLSKDVSIVDEDADVVLCGDTAFPETCRTIWWPDSDAKLPTTLPENVEHIVVGSTSWAKEWSSCDVPISVIWQGIPEELPPPPPNLKTRVTVLWFGRTESDLGAVLPALRHLHNYFHLITVGPYMEFPFDVERYEWSLSNIFVALQKSDICLLPVWLDLRAHRESPFRLLLAAKFEQAVAASPVHSFTRAAKHEREVIFCRTEQAWARTLSRLVSSPKYRQKLGQRALKLSEKRKFGREAQAALVLQLLEEEVEI